MAEPRIRQRGVQIGEELPGDQPVHPVCPVADKRCAVFVHAAGQIHAVADAHGVAGVVQRVVGAVGGKAQHFDGVLQRALAVFPQDLVGKDALEIIAVGERLGGDVMQEHIVQQHGDVVRPP